MVRTNPQLRQHQPPPPGLLQQDHQAFGHYHRPNRMLHPTRSQQQPSSSYRQYPPQMPRYHSEESLPSKAGTQGSGLYFSRIHFSRDKEGESPSPPSRPRSHAPWIYPSDIQIDPSSLEVSPKLPHMSFMPNNITGNGNNSGGSEDPLRDLRMPSVGPSPSTFTDDAISSREPTEEKEELVDDDDDDHLDDDDEDRNNDLRTRLNL